MRDERTTILNRLSQFLASTTQLFSVLGPPGVGKTKETLLWMLQTLLSDDTNSIFAWIRLEKGGAMKTNKIYIMQKIYEGVISYQLLESYGVVTDLREH